MMQFLEAFYYPLLILLLLLLTLFFYIFKKRIASFKIQKNHPSIKLILRDTFFSFIAIFFFIPSSAVSSLCYFEHRGFIYKDIHQYGVPYFILSLLLILVVHDTYYYWMHRLLHMRFLFKHIHYVHHVSHNTTVMTFYAMHPVESFLLSWSLPLCIFLFPVSIYAIMLGFALHTFYAIYGHSGYEWIPTKKLTRWINTATSHNLHHQNINVNYSYYFIFWDKIAGTLDKNYWRLLDRIYDRS